MTTAYVLRSTGCETEEFPLPLGLGALYVAGEPTPYLPPARPTRARLRREAAARARARYRAGGY